MGDQMKKITSTVMVVALMVVMLPCSRATNYTVGDNNGWTVGPNYTQWTAGKTFAVNDSLNFTFGSTHNVLQVNKAAYDACTSGNPISTNTTSPVTILLNSAGDWYFICGTTGHCSGGQKVMVSVTGSSTTPSTNSSPPPPSGTGSSGAGGLSVRMMVVEMFVAFAAFVLFLA